MSNLFFCVEGIDRRVNSAESRHCVKRDTILRNVWTQDSEDLSLAKTAFVKTSSDVADQFG